MGISMGQFPDIEFAYYAFKSGKLIKQTPTPPFWGDVGVKKWSQFFYSGTPKPIFGHLKMGTFGKSESPLKTKKLRGATILQEKSQFLLQ